MRRTPRPYARPTFTATEGVDDTAVTQTLAAAAGTIHVLDHLAVSYDKSPTIDHLVTVSIGGTVVFEVRVKAADDGPHFFPFVEPFETDDNEAMVISCAAAGTGAGDDVQAKISTRTR